jgi:hypothetical protein
MTADSAKDIQRFEAIGRIYAEILQFEHTIVITRNEPIVLTI